MNNKTLIFRMSLISVLLTLILAACSAAQPASETGAVSTQGSQPAASATTAPAETAVSSLPETGQDDLQAAIALAKLNLNTASAEDFLTITGMGERMVREFQEYRPYTSIEQFRREIGKYVSDGQVAEYENYVYVPISANESDAATLAQIPGLVDAEVQALIAARPFASDDAFLTALAQYVTAAELAAAKGYMGS